MTKNAIFRKNIIYVPENDGSVFIIWEKIANFATKL